MKFQHKDKPAELKEISLIPFYVDRYKSMENLRFYFAGRGNAFASLTTVLNRHKPFWLTRWENKIGKEEAKKRGQDAAERGTTFHKISEMYLNNGLDDLHQAAEIAGKDYGYVKEIYTSFFLESQLHLDRIDNIVATEQCLMSETMNVAGRTDCIAEFDGEVSVIDFKTKSKPPDKGWQEKQFLQCTGYAKMYEEMTGKQIDKLVIILATPEKTFLYTCDSRYRKTLIPKLEREANSFWNEIISPEVKL